MAAITQPSNLAQFREIHKNTWLKKIINAEGKKYTVGPKKSERSWVVFCVHDDTEAILEGYAEPRQAASHNPEWAVSMKNTLHISHALIPNSNEFEFVVTLSNEVIRFHAMSWEIMQEWVETLRSKLREMKIISPRENLYTKLPEIRPPLLPTRDPTSPLPLPPQNVQAAIVPGVEIVLPQNSQSAQLAPVPSQLSSAGVSRIAASTATTTIPNTTMLTDVDPPATTLGNNTPAMSNTATQNLLNMLSDPISSYSEHLQGASGSSPSYNARLTCEQLSSSLNDLRLNQSDLNENDDCLSPLLNFSSEESINIVGSSAKNADNKKRNSADQPSTVEKKLMQCDRLIPRPHTSRSQSAGAADKNKHAKHCVNKSLGTNITALEVTTLPGITKTTEETRYIKENGQSNITIIQVSSNDLDLLQETDDSSVPLLKSSTLKAAEIFKFPETHEIDVTINTSLNTTTNKPTTKQPDYKSNVQLIPSNSNVNSSTIKILGETPTSSNFVSASNQYSTPIKKKLQSQNSTHTTGVKLENHKITTVHVGGGSSVYGTCFSLAPEQESPITTPKLPKKVILSANTSGITNITVDSHNNRSQAKSQDNSIRCNVGSVHYEKVFLSSSTPIAIEDNATMPTNVTTMLRSPSTTLNNTATKTNDLTIAEGNNHKAEPKANIEQISIANLTPITSPQTPNRRISKAVQTAATTTSSTDEISNKLSPSIRSPLVQRRAAALRPAPMLTRGLTEAVITTRPSRRDLFISSSSTPKMYNAPMQAGIKLASKPTVNNNENGETSISLTDVLDQRRRSSSTSDATARAPRPARGSNNNELLSSIRPNAALRFQQPPQPYRNVENGLLRPPGLIGAAGMSPPSMPASASKRLTLREQQVMQLRREIMHPGGVRLQLRRKDCIGSIAWVEAFGAVWVAGWKQKEHPVLYNALHIGDQLLSIAGVSITNPTEANKIIRNANTLFVELLIRRMPFGCGIAIRRDREGQCLGLIRDGNTATIVDVVPNSLAARHGLPPKTQACDGTSLTFWVLTEINGRPLNLFFKDNEIRDRLNSLGRDISILVQPSDLITKLKKQLKSLRGYKDYLVQ